jgi:UDP-glucuronate 4-epimerase
MPMQAGDVPATFADIDSLKEAVGFKPDTDIKYGMQQFVAWFKAYYKLA